MEIMFYTGYTTTHNFFINKLIVMPIVNHKLLLMLKTKLFIKIVQTNKIKCGSKKD